MNPLRGESPRELGPALPRHGRRLRRRRCARSPSEQARGLGFALAEGVYAGLARPGYETPAEVRMLRALGADLGRHVDRARSDRRPPHGRCAASSSRWSPTRRRVSSRCARPRGGAGRGGAGLRRRPPPSRVPARGSRVGVKIMTQKRRAILTVLLAVAAGVALLAGRNGTPAGPAADLVLRNGRVVTVDHDAARGPGDRGRGRPHPRRRHGRRDRAASSGRAPRSSISRGRLAIPGFIEAHGHFLGLGHAKTILDLTKARSWDDIVAMVEAAAKTAAPGEWITGRGWHQERWEPTPGPSGRRRAAPPRAVAASARDNPVLLGHAQRPRRVRQRQGAWSSPASTRRTPNPPGGEIVRDAEGNPTGLLRETAQRLVGAAIERRRPARPADWSRRSCAGRSSSPARRRCRRASPRFHDAGSSLRDDRLLQAARGRGPAPGPAVRDGAARDATRRWPRSSPRYRMIGYGNHFLTVRSIKRQIDGALGAHGALLLAPYVDLPGEHRARPRGAGGHPAAPPRWRSSTAFRSTRTPSATAPTARCSTSTRRRSAPIPTRRTCAGGSSTRSTSPGRRAALRAARRHRLDAGRPRHLRRSVGAQTARARARQVRRLRLARAARRRRRHRQRHRRAGRGHRPDRELRRVGHAPDARTARRSIPSRAMTRAGGAALLHAQRRLRGVRGGLKGRSTPGKLADIVVLSQGHPEGPRRRDARRPRGSDDPRREGTLAALTPLRPDLRPASRPAGGPANGL